MASETNETREKSLNFLEEIIEESIAKGETRVQTRFPPEPNGYLHIGHAKSICINFGLARKYGGKCNLRFDDTNPVKEDVEYVDSIKRDIQWLGFDWAVERYASDYFDQLYDWAIVLIKKGLAYVDDQTQEQIRENRGTVSVPGTPSPWRDRSVEENLDLFVRMKNGEFPDGAKVLRAKIDMAHPNMLFRDPIMYRIIHAEHHRTGDKWCIYPMYDYAHGQSDSIEQITHSICTLEFDVHRPLYDWFIQALEIYPSHQYEFARLNLTYTMMSKRKLLKLVQEGAVMGWDDPRMPTICALRRKGYTPASVRNFAEMVGVAKRDNVIDLGKLEYCVREDLNKIAERRMAVLNPLKVVITNYEEGKTELFTAINNPEDESAGTRQVPFSKVIYIERDDFMEEPPKKFFRLAPGGDVRLRLTVTDKHGISMERILTTTYKNPPITATYTQEGYELAAMDRAYVTFTVSQPGYTGRYKARLNGEGATFFQGHYSADIPKTELTLYEGNGTYELRIKPEAVGEIPFTVTITDEQGNSTFFESSVKGVKTTANFSLDFRLMTGALDIVMESSYPVSEDLKITVTASVKIVYSGGYTRMQDYTFDVFFEAERSRGTGYVYLDLQGRYDISIVSYTMESDTPVSLNGMVEYKLQ